MHDSFDIGATGLGDRAGRFGLYGVISGMGERPHRSHAVPTVRLLELARRLAPA
jgi:hypothetical protein